jgi:hypothetical protein
MRKGALMRIRFGLIAAFGVMSACAMLVAQTAPSPQAPAPPRRPAIDGWTGHPVLPTESNPPVPAPRRDLTGTWEPANGPGDGIQPFGAKNMPDDGKPEHLLPFTPAGLAAMEPHKPGFGTRAVEPDEINDPVNSCDPQGMPRQDLYEVRSTQIVQTPKKIVLLYEYNKIWRVIWMDGRQLPQDPEPQWYGYSVGKWIDDYTFVAETVGTDPRTWVDNAGRPHSGEMRIEERFHRVNRDRLELTVTLTDPKFYSKPWVALDKFPMNVVPDDFHVREMVCSPSEYQQYLKTFVGK